MNLTTTKHFNIINSIRQRLQEDAAADAEADSQRAYDRAQDTYLQQQVQDLMTILQGRGRATGKLSDAYSLLQTIFGDLENDDDDESDETVDGQDQVRFGGRTTVKLRPTT
jgi:hypothetical protein